MICERSALPPPELDGGASLNAALARRRSVRAFAPRPLTRSELGQLLWAAQGQTDAREGKRAAPSAGALYPLAVYAATDEGLARDAVAVNRSQTLVQDCRVRNSHPSSPMSIRDGR